MYSFAYGDEPWVGHFGGSEGDVGWYGGGLIRYEGFISPTQYRYAGFWDYGNDAAGEKHIYTGYANFIEWLSPTPSYVFLSNTIDNCCNELLPLSSIYRRSINIVYLNQILMPAESRDHVFAIGIAGLNPKDLPKKPDVNILY